MYAVIDRNTPAGTSLSPELYPEGWVMVLDKPYRWTSADAVRKIKFTLKKLYHQNNIKVGHAGTLDPLATGVLLICAGKATKVSEALQAERKEYIAEVTFGATTPSFDMEHEVDKTYPFEHITREMVEKALVELSGERLQTPPLYSAKKIEGQRAYEYAREGTEVELRQALVNIYEMELLEFDLPRIRLRIRCSKGTYIRSIARELGEALDSGGYLSSLRRTRSGGFTADEGMSMEEVADSLAALREMALAKSE